MTALPLVLTLLLAGSKRAEVPPTPTPAPDVLSLNLKNADLCDVALHLATFAGLSVVIGPEVQGRVTISLKDVTPELALSTILKVHGYGFLREGRVIRIGTVARLLASDR